MRSVLVATAAAVVLGCAFAAPASADPFTLGDPVTVTGPSPFAPGCGGPGEAGPSSVLYQNGEVEPSVAVNPTNPNNIVGFWQQDRWSDGGAHGLLAGFSRDGGQNWSPSAPQFTTCAGGTGDSGGYERASDPWVSFGPTGTLHAISISFDNSTPRNAVLASRSTDGGATWSDPAVLRFDNPRALGNNFNDKESITADPTDAHFVYAIWDRLISPSNNSSARAFERSVSFHGPTWLARSTDDGVTWEPARPIFDPKSQNQTIANQIVVLPDGTVVDGFTLLNGHKNAHGTRGGSVALLRSHDKGQTWESKPTIVNSLQTVGVVDPDPDAPCPDPDSQGACPVRTGDIVYRLDRGHSIQLLWFKAEAGAGGRSDALEREKRLGRTKGVSEALAGAAGIALRTLPAAWNHAADSVQMDQPLPGRGRGRPGRAQPSATSESAGNELGDCGSGVACAGNAPALGTAKTARLFAGA